VGEKEERRGIHSIVAGGNHLKSNAHGKEEKRRNFEREKKKIHCTKGRERKVKRKVGESGTEGEITLSLKNQREGVPCRKETSGQLLREPAIS